MVIKEDLPERFRAHYRATLDAWAETIRRQDNGKPQTLMVYAPEQPNKNVALLIKLRAELIDETLVISPEDPVSQSLIDDFFSDIPDDLIRKDDHVE